MIDLSEVERKLVKVIQVKMPGTDNLTLEIIYFTDENFCDLLLVVLILEYKLFE